jgi:hypothetical protein
MVRYRFERLFSMTLLRGPRGRVIQVDPIKPALKALGTKILTLEL